METQDKSFSDLIIEWFSGDSKPEININTVVDLETTTLLKIVGWCALLVVGGIALNNFLLRATLRRFFGKN